MFKALREKVYDANMLLPKHGLVSLTWGNVSQAQREKGVFGIKPSGVDYQALNSESIVVLDFKGNILEGDLIPSSDTPTHLYLYNQFKEIGGIVHTHSKFATCFAQAGRGIPCLGTTHADSFYGNIPVSRKMNQKEIKIEYEKKTGGIIVETLKKLKLSPQEMPGILVHSHGPFTWGKDAAEAVENACILESVAEMAVLTNSLHKKLIPIDSTLLDKHFFRKHGKNAYYGQAI